MFQVLPHKKTILTRAAKGAAIVDGVILKRAFVAALPLVLIVGFTAGCAATPSTTASAGSSAAAVKPAANKPNKPKKPAVSWYVKQYGTFAPITKSGTSDAVIPLPAGTEAAIVTASYQGQDAFIVTGLDAKNQQSSDLLVDTVGAYSGTSASGFELPSQSKSLQVQATGAWTMSIKPVSSAPTLTIPAKGKGDAVYLYDGTPQTVKVTHDGQANFMVNQYAKDSDMPGMGINEIGRYSGQVPMLGGSSVIVIQADGNWTISK